LALKKTQIGTDFFNRLGIHRIGMMKRGFVWRDGEVARWRDSEMVRWRDGEVARWRDGEVESKPVGTPVSTGRSLRIYPEERCSWDSNYAR